MSNWKSNKVLHSSAKYLLMKLYQPSLSSRIQDIKFKHSSKDINLSTNVLSFKLILKRLYRRKLFSSHHKQSVETPAHRQTFSITFPKNKFPRLVVFFSPYAPWEIISEMFSSLTLKCFFIPKFQSWLVNKITKKLGFRRTSHTLL